MSNDAHAMTPAYPAADPQLIVHLSMVIPGVSHQPSALSLA